MNRREKQLKSIVAIFTAIVSFIGGYFSDLNGAILFPEGPQTDTDF